MGSIKEARRDYSLKSNLALENKVRLIEKEGIPGIIKPGALDRYAEQIDAHRAMKGLPPGLSEEEFINSVKLSLLTEAATDSYAEKFYEISRAYGQPWLGEFIERVWVLDEYGHAAPFKKILMQLGSSESTLDQEIKHSQEADYIHRSGGTPIHATVYGMIQEYLTDHWYRLQMRILKDAGCSDAALMVAAVKKRETLHTKWYMEMTALQIDQNPHLIPHVAETFHLFSMPGNEIIPELQGQVVNWLPKMGADFTKMQKDIVRWASYSVGDSTNRGKLILEFAQQQGVHLGPIKPEHIQKAFYKLGGPGFGLLGEALMEVAGINGPVKDQDKGLSGKIRSVVRKQIAAQIDHQLIKAAFTT
jgi:hypothetical protein